MEWQHKSDSQHTLYSSSQSLSRSLISKIVVYIQNSYKFGMVWTKSFVEDVNSLNKSISQTSSNYEVSPCFMNDHSICL